MAISLITSLYRSEKHLPDYIKRVQSVAAQVDIPLEIVLVANDATETEHQLLATLQQNATFPVTLIHTERENLYASWNRGFEAAQFDILGSWNVDDVRTAEGILAGRAIVPVCLECGIAMRRTWRAPRRPRCRPPVRPP